MEIYNLALWSLWGSFLFTLLLVTWIFKSKNTDWGRFWVVWFLTATITAMILVLFLMIPEKIELFVNDILKTIPK